MIFTSCLEVVRQTFTPVDKLNSRNHKSSCRIVVCHNLNTSEAIITIDSYHNDIGYFGLVQYEYSSDYQNEPSQIGYMLFCCIDISIDLGFKIWSVHHWTWSSHCQDALTLYRH